MQPSCPKCDQPIRKGERGVKIATGTGNGLLDKIFSNFIKENFFLIYHERCLVGEDLEKTVRSEIVDSLEGAGNGN